MMFTKLFVWNTQIGPFYIAMTSDRRFHPVYNDESLGSYARPDQAAEDLAGGHVFSIRGRVDIKALKIPADLGEWERIRPPQR